MPIPLPLRSKQWNRAERIYHCSMRELLPRMVRQFGMEGAAKQLLVTPQTISLWGIRLGLSRVTVFLGEDEELIVRKRPSQVVEQVFNPIQSFPPVPEPQPIMPD
jgi:hypothetical protein